jgi:transcriptional regulator with XRE-family HTH domain
MASSTVLDRIKKRREEKGFTPKEMAEKLMIEERAYKRIEGGERKSLDFNMMLNIAKILEMDITELIPSEDGVNIANSMTNSTGHVTGVLNGREITILTTDDSSRKLFDITIAELKGVIQDKNLIIEELKAIIASKKA